jgi:2-isopropylmalate synthase
VPPPCVAGKWRRIVGECSLDFPGDPIRNCAISEAKRLRCAKFQFSAQDIFDIFEREFGLFSLRAPRHQVIEGGEADGIVRLAAEIVLDGRPLQLRGAGNGPIDAFIDGLAQACGQSIRVLDYHEHAIGAGSGAQAIAYLELRIGERTLFGVGQDADIVSASLRAVLSGLERARASAGKLAAVRIASR